MRDLSANRPAIQRLDIGNRAVSDSDIVPEFESERLVKLGGVREGEKGEKEEGKDRHLFFSVNLFKFDCLIFFILLMKPWMGYIKEIAI